MPDFVLRGTPPSKKNSKIISCVGTRPRLFPSKTYVAWHKEALVQLKDQKVKPEKHKEIRTITLTFFSKDKRKYDLTNKAESVMDLLVDYGFIEDDNFAVLSCIQLVYGGMSKTAPRVEVEYNV